MITEKLDWLHFYYIAINEIAYVCFKTTTFQQAMQIDVDIKLNEVLLHVIKQYVKL